MMYPPFSQSFLSLLSKKDAIVLIGHKEPDGDCLGSQIALNSYFSRLGKETLMLSPGPFNRKEIIGKEDLFLQTLPPCFKQKNPLAIVLDCSTMERVSPLEKEISDLYIGVIDHHSSGENFGNYRYVVPQAPSTTLLVLHLIESLGGFPTTAEAEELFFGFVTDTGFFRHLDKHSEAAFNSIAALIKAGAAPKKAYARMYGDKSPASRELLGRLLARITYHYNSKLLVTTEYLTDLQELGAEARDSDALYQLMINTSGCEAAVLIREESAHTSSVGLRSLDEIDVGAIAKQLGGGGHKNAAGYSIENTPSPQIQQRILKSFAPCF